MQLANWLAELSDMCLRHPRWTSTRNDRQDCRTRFTPSWDYAHPTSFSFERSLFFLPSLLSLFSSRLHSFWRLGTRVLQSSLSCRLMLWAMATCFILWDVHNYIFYLDASLSHTHALTIYAFVNYFSCQRLFDQNFRKIWRIKSEYDDFFCIILIILY